jgi:hypothetical protein
MGLAHAKCRAGEFRYLPQEEQEYVVVTVTAPLLRTLARRAVVCGVRVGGPDRGAEQPTGEQPTPVQTALKLLHGDESMTTDCRLPSLSKVASMRALLPSLLK